MLTKSHRYMIAAVGGTLLLLTSGCLDASTTLGTPPPQAPTTPTSQPPISRTLPAWAALPDGAEAYYEVSSLYSVYSEYHGAIRSRYVLYDAARFGLQVVSARFGPFEYTGRYQRSDSTLLFRFDAWNVAGPWIATGVLSDTQLGVSYNGVMLLADFVDGNYLRLATPPD